MPKPVLSDSLFNADDVATAVLNSADLSVTNQDFGVVDITSSFTRDSDWNQAGSNDAVFYFNGFVFYNLGAVASDAPTGTVTVWTIASPYRPQDNFYSNTISYQRDTVAGVTFKPDGTVTIAYATEGSGSDDAFRIYINGWYRT